MTPASRRVLLGLGKCVDLAVCAASLLVASALVYSPLWKSDTVLLRHPLWQLLLGVALISCWHIALAATGAYESYRIGGLRKQASALVLGTVLVTVLTGIWLLLSRKSADIELRASLAQLAIFWVLALTGFLSLRIAARLLTRSLRRHGRNLRNFMVVGTNRRAVALARDMSGRRDFGYRLVGFVDHLWHDEKAPDEYKKMLLGDCSHFLELLRNLAVDEVIVALPIASFYRQIEQIILWCHQQGILVRCEGSLFDTTKHGMPDLVSLQQLITVHGNNRHELSSAAKRLLDILISGTVLVLLLPLLAVVAIAIKISSPGPIIFAQERLGVGKRRFRIFKFRTMVINAEELMASLEHLNQSGGPTFKLKRDPRITRVGAFLRKTSLDELPQLFNVLIGDMSLVGPRPLPMRDYRGFSEDWHRRRFTVRPGITCLWQVQGRSTIGFDRWMELDMDYIDHWSLWLDFKILLQTIPAVVRGSGAM